MQLGENARGDACRFSHAREVQFSVLCTSLQGGHGGTEAPLLSPLHLALTPRRYNLPPHGFSSAHQALSWLTGRKETQPASTSVPVHRASTQVTHKAPPHLPHQPRPCQAASCVSARRHDAREKSNDGFSDTAILTSVAPHNKSRPGVLGGGTSGGLWRRRGR